MDKYTDHSIRVKRALAMSDVGRYPASAAAMLDAIPAEVIAALPARLIAKLLDANWALAQASKCIAEKDALAEGAIWDASGNRYREIAA